MSELLETYEQVLSRFRDDSLVAEIGRAKHGGNFDFPDWTEPLFGLYDALFAATSGAIDPCIGEDLIRLGYDASLSFTVKPGSAEHLGALRGRPTWGDDVERRGTTLITRRPVDLDFGRRVPYMAHHGLRIRRLKMPSDRLPPIPALWPTAWPPHCSRPARKS